jgi:hypothetical protein
MSISAYTGFCLENSRKKDHLQDLGVVGSIIIPMDLQEVGCGGMERNEPAQDRDRWRALVSDVMYVWVPYNAGNFLIS